MKMFLFIATAGVALVASIAAALYVWIGAGDTQMGGHGWAALILGTVLSLVVGGGLMVLVFYSARHGYDEAAMFKDSDHDQS